MIEQVKNKTETNAHVFKALEEKRFFKLICGASFNDVDSIENLVFVFTLAGAHVIDLAPRADVIFAARRGIEKALNIHSSPLTSHLPSLTSHLSPPLLMASIQIDSDPHFRKVVVDHSLCDICGVCVQVCPTEAFSIRAGSLELSSQLSALSSHLSYSIERCFGCGVCPADCHVDALKMVDIKPSPVEMLEEMISLDIRAIEFHFGKNYKKLGEIWSDMKSSISKLELISFSIGSNMLSDAGLKEAANLCYKLAGSGIILQCDGIPMSGAFGKTGNNNDKSFIEVAKIIQNENLPVYLQISGGTNENSFRDTVELGLNISGLAIGSHARKILMPLINDLNFAKSQEKVYEAVKIAKILVSSINGDK